MTGTNSLPWYHKKGLEGVHEVHPEEERPEGRHLALPPSGPVGELPGGGGHGARGDGAPDGLHGGGHGGEGQGDGLHPEAPQQLPGQVLQLGQQGEGGEGLLRRDCLGGGVVLIDKK